MSDTIAAIATPQVPSAIGILRISGPNTLSVLNNTFHIRQEGASFASSARKMIFGDICNLNGEIIDHGMAVFFPGPHSYTGEDSAEIYGHGSPITLNETLESLFHFGARQASGGEFTKRAFLNGKMDLIQAEAVIDLIDAETRESAHNAIGQISGILSRKIDEIYETLMSVTSRFYAVVDYPDEDIEDLQREDLLDALRRSENSLTELRESFSRGQLLKLGVPTVIVGRPNAGKSSLLNALLGYDRAIVTDIPGTTRDTVEEKAKIGHVLLRLCDTAGIRNTSDTVEQIGVDRAKQAATQASLALLVLDGSQPLNAEDEEAISIATTVPNLLVLVNKCDLPLQINIGNLADRFDHVISLSAKNGIGMDTLSDAIKEMYPANTGNQGELLTNSRQVDAVNRALHAVQSARASLRIGMTPDVVLTDTEGALQALGELNGKAVREELVSTIFSRFCVGK